MSGSVFVSFLFSLICFIEAGGLVQKGGVTFQIRGHGGIFEHTFVLQSTDAGIRWYFPDLKTAAGPFLFFLTEICGNSLFHTMSLK